MPTKQNLDTAPTSVAGMNLPQNALVLLVVGVVLGFVLGHLYTKVSVLEKGTGGAAMQEQGGEQAADNSAPKELKIAKPDPKKDHWDGPADARYVHVEYSDFECPFCGAYAPTMAQLKKDYAGKMAFVYRHFPLSFHPLATPTAEASECVADLGGNKAFWKFHDDVFAAMPNVTVEGLGSFASKAGVNQGAFKKCYDARKFKAKVEAQFNEGSTAGIAATPTSVIYDMKTGKTAVIEGAQPLPQAKAVIDGLMN